MENKRIMLWDNLKFFLICLVVIGHFVDYYIESDIYKSIFIFIYSFHMPLFIFAAGLFHRNKNIPYKVYTYIVLSFILKIFIFLTRNLVDQDTDLKFNEESGVPWYMFALAIFILITYILRNINKTYILITWIIVACFCGYDNSIEDTFSLSRIIIFYPFYLMGTMVDREALENLAHNRKLKISAGILIGLWMSACIVLQDKIYELRPLFTGRHPFEDMDYNSGCFHRLLCYAMSVGIGLCIILIMPTSHIPFISKAGRCSVQVYFWHRPILYILASTDALLLCQNAAGRLLWILCAIALTCILSTKYFSFPAMYMLRDINGQHKNLKGRG